MKLVFTLIAVCFSVLLNAQKAGTLDLSFGDSGKVLSTTQTGFPFEANAVIVKDDGRILVGSGEYAFLLKQFLSDGTPDTSFGESGEVKTEFGDYISETITGMAITNNGKIITAGYGGAFSSNPHGADILLAQYDDK